MPQREHSSRIPFLGKLGDVPRPVLSYRQEKWWAALTVMPQVYGWNNSRSQDGNTGLELNDHEKVNIRLLFGFNF